MCTVNSISLKKKMLITKVMNIDKKSGIGIIIGISIIFATLSLITLPEIEAEPEDPWSYQTMRTKLLNSELNPSDFAKRP